MTDYILSNAKPAGSTLVFDGHTYTVANGSPVIAEDCDTFLMDPNSSTTSWQLGSNGHNINIDIVIPEFMDASGARLSFSSDTSGTVSPNIIVAQGSTYGDINLANAGPSTVMVEKDATVSAINGSPFDDDIRIQDDATAERVIAGAGNDSIILGNNVGIDENLAGGDGNDQIWVGEHLTMGSENPSIGGGSGNDTITVGNGFSSTFGGRDIYGGSGDDFITAGSYSSTSQLNREYAINGGNGDDTLNLLAQPTDIQAGYEDKLAAKSSLALDPTTGRYAGNTNQNIDIRVDLPGQPYFLDLEDFSTYAVGETPPPPPCFARGTLIETDHGVVEIENLKKGDLVFTRDNGLQEIIWVGGKTLSQDLLAANDKLRPIRIARHALGVNTPSSDLIVSPQHRILVRSKIAKRLFGAEEVLVAAKHLLALDGVDIASDILEVEYFHILFNRHEVILSNGAETESLYTGPEALKGLSEEAREEIFTIFPELMGRDYTPSPARMLMQGQMGSKLAHRHKTNGKALVSER